MSDRAVALAERFERANAELIAAVEELPEARWSTVVPGVEWPLDVTVRHVAAGHVAVRDLFVRPLVAGQGLPPVTFAMIDRGNAAHAREHGGCGKDAALAQLRGASAEVAAYLRGLSDAELDRAAPARWWDGRVMTAEEVVQVHMTDHVAGHLSSIRAALGQ